ncbi:MAG: lysophospholipid acyltransferase family protein [Succinivibrio sp.]
MILFTGTYRVIVTALLFTFFGIGALFLSTVVFSVICIVIRDRNKRIYFSRKATAISFKLFVIGGAIFRILTVKVKGLDKIDNDKGVVYICNHPSLIDYVILTSLLKGNLSCVVKGKLTFNPFLKGIIACNNYIPNSVGAEEMLNKCRNLLVSGDSLLIFPEGTRTVDESRLKFTHGFASIAINAKAPVRPVVIRYSGRALRKHVPWYYTFFVKSSYEIEFLDLFDTRKFIEDNQDKESSALSRILATKMQDHIFTIKTGN